MICKGENITEMKLIFTNPSEIIKIGTVRVRGNKRGRREGMGVGGGERGRFLCLWSVSPPLPQNCYGRGAGRGSEIRARWESTCGCYLL